MYRFVLLFLPGSTFFTNNQKSVLIYGTKLRHMMSKYSKIYLTSPCICLATCQGLLTAEEIEEAGGC